MWCPRRGCLYRQMEAEGLGGWIVRLAQGARSEGWTLGGVSLTT